MESNPPFHENYKTLLGSLFEGARAERAHHNKLVTLDEFEQPLIDLNRLNLDNLEREKCKREIVNAASRYGVFQVVNHGVSPETLERMRSEQVKLFQQPFYKKADEKFLNLSPNCYSWGNPTAITLMQFSWSEAFHIPLHEILASGEFKSLSSAVEEFTTIVSELAQRIAEILAENLGCKSTFFAENCLPSSSFVRLNRYPPCPISSKVLGLAAHTDSDFLTILYQDRTGGLQVFKDGKWVNLKPNPEALVLHIGDLFQAWSNDVYKSVEHRVVANQEVERFSFAYFVCPSYDTVIQSCSEPSIYKEFSFREYRQQVKEDVKTTGGKIGLPRFRR